MFRSTYTSGHGFANCSNTDGTQTHDSDNQQSSGSTAESAGGWDAACSSDAGGEARGLAGATASAVSFNVLRAAASASASGFAIDLGEPRPYPPYIQAVYGAATASALADATVSDVLYFPSDGYWSPSGHVTATLSVTGSSTICSWAQFNAQVQIGGIGVSLSTNACASSGVAVPIGDSTAQYFIPAGATLSFVGVLRARADAMASLANHASTTVDASRTLEFYLTPLTPGATVISASGTNYLPPGPIPGPDPYEFSPFFPPLQNAPGVNVVKAGSAVPLKFSLEGYRGLDVLAPDSPSSQRVQCSDSSAVEELNETVSPGSAELSYDSVQDQYSYIWKTNRAWAGTCRTLVVKLKNGSARFVHFAFK